MTLCALLPPLLAGVFGESVCMCVRLRWDVEGGCLVSLLWLQSVYRLQVIPGLDKGSPIPPRCLDQFVTQPE